MVTNILTIYKMSYVCDGVFFQGTKFLGNGLEYAAGCRSLNKKRAGWLPDLDFDKFHAAVTIYQVV
ncbi:hypothetical protein, partial [Candidatus Methanomassiliicoccus intestinalis]|uniref:hypothetical protein n=1 Tax=Candidatus Methanomassiliicoccus intestinalis TaxID=1406512 RepID=UPI0037DCE672